MQASLKDLSTNPTSQSFQVCQRVLTQCHEIIFGNLPTPSSPYATLQIPFQSRFARRKIKPLVEPAFVGLAMVLAGAPGVPQLTPTLGRVAVEQGRAATDGPEISGLEHEISREPVVLSSTIDDNDDGNSDDEDDDDGDGRPPPDSPQEDEPPFDASVANLSRRTTIGPSQTAPALRVHVVAKPRLSYDPFGQEDPQPTNSPSHSTPSFLPTRKHHPNAPSKGETLLQRYDRESQIHLLRSHFCRSEVRPTGTEDEDSLNLTLTCPGPICAHTREHFESTVNYP